MPARSTELVDERLRFRLLRFVAFAQDLLQDLARAFETIAKGGGRLPGPVLEALTKAVLEAERNARIRVHAVYALAHSAAHYPQAKAVLVEATRDGVQDVRRAAEHGLRIVEAERLFAQREPMAVALDRSLPVESRLKAMGPLKVNRTDAAWRAGVIALARQMIVPSCNRVTA